MNTTEWKRLYNKKYHQEHKEELSRKERKRYKNNEEYRKKINQKNREWQKEKRKNDSVWRDKEIKRSKIKDRNIVIKCLTYYSIGDFPICCCCDESDVYKLTLDHINGGGNKHRMNIKTSSGINFYRWVIRNNFPSGYQVLCFNCNGGKYDKLVCPHKWSKKEIDKKLSSSYYKYIRIPILKKFSKNCIIECVNCKEKNIFQLAIDHINGGGKKHRSSFKNRYEYYIFLRDKALVSDFQILCHNCNHLKRIEKLNLN